jgi:hypothetical protein
MLLYRGSISTKNIKNSTLKHFGSKLAAAHRLESMFSSQSRRAFNLDDGHFHVIDYKAGSTKNESIAEAVSALCQFMSSMVIYQVNVDINNPLRLHDCWQDDPIGSGGLCIFEKNETLSASQRKSLESIFSPFKGVIYPPTVRQLVNPKTVASILKSASGNALLKDQLSQRKERLIAIGQYSKDEMFHEAVWVDLTLKLRLWALENGFDSFVYENTSEGGGEDSYVVLRHNQVENIVGKYLFDSEKYTKAISADFLAYLHSTYSASLVNSTGSKKPIVANLFWANLDPLNFWISV